MIAIVNYGVGNLFSLESSFNKIGAEVKVTANPDELKNSERIILPGVGAFGDAAKKLFSSGLAEPLKIEALNGKPVLGICVGMQLLFEKSFEFGEHKGLNLIPGSVKAISEVIPDNLKIPQIGWNALNLKNNSKIFKYTNQNEYVYFVHSYSAFCPQEFITSTVEYGADLVASVENKTDNKNIFGVQFHPEKSGNSGLKILKAFCEV